jgi:hypothetical protein
MTEAWKDKENNRTKIKRKLHMTILDRKYGDKRKHSDKRKQKKFTGLLDRILAFAKTRGMNRLGSLFSKLNIAFLKYWFTEMA